MHPLRQSIGPLAFGLGAVSVALVALAVYLRSLLHKGSWTVLRVAEQLGLLANPETAGLPAFKPTSLLDLNDATAVQVLLAFGLYLAVSGQAVAVWAEARGEESLYLAAGLTCSNLAIFLHNRTAGLIAFGLSTLLVLAVRRARRVVPAHIDEA